MMNNLAVQTGMHKPDYTDVFKYRKASDNNRQVFPGRSCDGSFLPEPKKSHDINKVQFQKTRILIADEAEPYREHFRECLINTNIKIKEAVNGVSALMMAKELKPDLIIADLRLPLINGFELMRKIRLDREIMDIPVIAYSSLALKDQQNLIKAFGFSGLLVKPASVDDLFRELTKHLSLSGVENQLTAADSVSVQIDDNIADVNELIRSLETEFTDKWDRFKVKQPVDELIEFGNRLKTTGERHRAVMVTGYGEELIHSAVNLDVRAIARLLRRFPLIINDLKNIGRSVTAENSILKDVCCKTVLVVDDNPDNVNFLGQILKKENYRVEFAADGYSALGWADSEEFDLILLNIDMPGTNGFETGLRIRNSDVNGDTPLIFLTSDTDPHNLEKSFASGGNDYITEPFNISELLTRIKAQINIKKKYEQVRKYLNEIEAKNLYITQSLQYANYIQKAILGSVEDAEESFPEHFILNIPKDIISGDFYRFYKIGNKIIAAVMDCTGHGVPGALMSILGITFFNEIVLKEKILQPDEILNRLKEKIVQSLGNGKNLNRIRDGMEGSVICYDSTSRLLQFAGSYNPIIMAGNNRLSEIKADRNTIGESEANQKFHLNEMHLSDNEMVYLFTDGYNDQLGGDKNKKFLISRLRELLLKIYNHPMADQSKALSDNFINWKKDYEQTDDILILGIRFS